MGLSKPHTTPCIYMHVRSLPFSSSAFLLRPNGIQGSLNPLWGIGAVEFKLRNIVVTEFIGPNVTFLVQIKYYTVVNSTMNPVRSRGTVIGCVRSENYKIILFSSALTLNCIFTHERRLPPLSQSSPSLLRDEDIYPTNATLSCRL